MHEISKKCIFLHLQSRAGFVLKIKICFDLHNKQPRMSVHSLPTLETDWKQSCDIPSQMSFEISFQMYLPEFLRGHLWTFYLSYCFRFEKAYIHIFTQFHGILGVCQLSDALLDSSAPKHISPRGCMSAYSWI